MVKMKIFRAHAMKLNLQHWKQIVEQLYKYFQLPHNDAPFEKYQRKNDIKIAGNSGMLQFYEAHNQNSGREHVRST